MLNVKAINEALMKRPLCSGHIIAQRGLAIEYCAMGALGKECGATDEYLKTTEVDGSGIFAEFKLQLREKFGIETLDQFQNLMKTNDSIDSPLQRGKAVCNTVIAMSPDAINKIMAENTPEAYSYDYYDEKSPSDNLPQV